MKRETVTVLVETIEVPIEAEDEEEAGHKAKRRIEKGVNWRAWKIVSNKQMGGAFSVEEATELETMPACSTALANPLQKTLF